MDVTKTVIIIPTYNESLVIKDTISQVFAALSHCCFDVHILVFDSCSTDTTQAIVTELQATFPALHLATEAKKSGLGSAYWQAMQYAMNQLGAEIIVEFDADLSHQPQYLLPILELMRSYDVVVGSRYVQGGSIPINWGWHRKLLSQWGNLISRLMLTLRYKDFTSGFRATRSALLKKALPAQFISNQYAYKIELLWNLHRANAKIIEYPIEFIDREKGYSKLPANSIFDSLRVLCTLRFRELKSYLNMCLVGAVGLIIQCVLYNLLRVKFSPLVAIQLAVSAAIVNNFVLNHQFTFRKRQMNQRVKSFIFFLGYSAFMVGFQSLWVRLGTQYFGTGYLKENLIMLSGVILGSVLNYLCYSRLIWRERKDRVALPG